MSCYNPIPGYLYKAVDSILNQTYPNFELIIVDDGSTDNLAICLNKYNDSRIRLIRNEKNMGIAYSENLALDNCRGEYVAVMDSDDISYPDRLEKQLAYMRVHPDVIACGTWAHIIDENDQPTGESYHGVISDMEDYRIYLLFGNTPTIVHSSVLFNRRLLLKYNIKYDTEYTCSLDYKMWVTCAQYARCHIIPEILLEFIVHSKSFTSARIDDQNFHALKNIQNQLDSLHLVLPDEIKFLHLHFFTLPDVSPFDMRLKRWMRSIVRANKKYRVYDQTKLKRIILKGQIRVLLLYFAKKLGLK